MLARKGYPPGTAYAVVRAELDLDAVEVDDVGEGDEISEAGLTDDHASLATP